MELRKKPVFWQRLLETLFRLRLIFLLLSFVIFTFLFLSRNDLFSFLLGTSESLSIKVSSFFSLADLKPYFPLLGGCLVIFILRLILGGLFSGFAFLGIAIIVPSALFVLDGSDNVIIKLLLWCGLISFLLSFLIPKAWIKALFPFFIGALVLSGFAIWTDVNYLTWTLSFILFFADALTVGFGTGVHLNEGMPKAGSLIQASLKQLLVITLGSFIALTLALFTSKIWTLDALLSQSLFWFAYLGTFFLLFFSYYSFMPLDRLRSQKRQVKIKNKSLK